MSPALFWRCEESEWEVQTQLMLELGNQRGFKKIFWKNMKEPPVFILHSLSPLSLVKSSPVWCCFLTLVYLLKYNSLLRSCLLLDTTWSRSSSHSFALPKKVVYMDGFIFSLQPAIIWTVGTTFHFQSFHLSSIYGAGHCWLLHAFSHLMFVQFQEANTSIL